MTTAFPSGAMRAPRMSVAFMNSSREIGGLVSAEEVCAPAADEVAIRRESRRADVRVVLIGGCDGFNGVGESLQGYAKGSADGESMSSLRRL